MKTNEKNNVTNVNKEVKANETKKATNGKKNVKVESTKIQKAPAMSKTKALQNLREAGKEVRSINGVIKIIRQFWNNGYKEAFAYLGLKYDDINFKTISDLWAKSLKIEDKTEKGKMLFAYYGKETVYKADEKGNFILDKDGKKIKELDASGKPKTKKVLKECVNFTVLRVFDAVLNGKIERKEITLGSFGVQKAA